MVFNLVAGQELSAKGEFAFSLLVTLSQYGDILNFNPLLGTG